MTTIMIDLNQFTGDRKVRNLSGKERGIAARRELKLDDVDIVHDEVEVVIPDYLDTISPSFFQGLFSQSIDTLKGKDGFLKKYRFRATENAMRWIELGIRNATSERGRLI